MKISEEMSEISEQYKFEINAWLRTLDYLQQENIHMKTHLAEVLKAHVNETTLEKAEYYQNVFLNKDTVIAFMRRDINKLKANGIDGHLPPRFLEMRSDIGKMEHEFSNLKTEFNNSVLEIMNTGSN